MKRSDNQREAVYDGGPIEFVPGKKEVPKSNGLSESDIKRIANAVKGQPVPEPTDAESSLQFVLKEDLINEPEEIEIIPEIQSESVESIEPESPKPLSFNLDDDNEWLEQDTSS